MMILTIYLTNLLKRFVILIFIQAIGIIRGLLIYLIICQKCRQGHQGRHADHGHQDGQARTSGSSVSCPICRQDHQGLYYSK